MHVTEASILSSRGQTQIPAAIRKAAGLNVGSRLLWSADESGEIRVHAIVDDPAQRRRRWRQHAAKVWGELTADQILAEQRSSEAGHVDAAVDGRLQDGRG